MTKLKPKPKPKKRKKAAKAPVRPVGRPSVYRPEMCQEVIEYGKLGLSLTQIACRLDVTRETIYSWCSEKTEFSDAIKRASQFAQDWWESKGQEGLVMPGFNASLWSKSMAARFPNDYMESRRMELMGKDGGPIEHRDVSKLSDAELKAELAAMIAQTPSLQAELKELLK